MREPTGIRRQVWREAGRCQTKYNAQRNGNDAKKTATPDGAAVPRKKIPQFVLDNLACGGDAEINFLIPILQFNEVILLARGHNQLSLINLP